MEGIKMITLVVQWAKVENLAPMSHGILLQKQLQGPHCATLKMILLRTPWKVN
jgi:hypothetical protein